MPVYLYSLVDPRFNAVRYVGRTVNPKERIKAHRSPGAARRNNHLGHWLAELRQDGAQPTMQIIQVVDTWDESGTAERALIAQMRADGVDLVNGTDGGEGALGRKLGEDGRRRISAARRGKPTTTGRKRTESERAAVSRAHKGIPLTAEHRAKIAAAGVGRKPTPETCEKLSAAHRGKPKTQDHRNKLRAANLGKCLPDEVRNKCGKLTPDDVRAIKERLRAGESSYILARDFSVTYDSIRNIAKGKTWSHIQVQLHEDTPNCATTRRSDTS